MRCSGVHKDRISRTRVEGTTIARTHFNLLQIREVVTSASSQLGIDLDTGDAPTWPDNLCENRGVVSGAAAEDEGANAAMITRATRGPLPGGP